MVTAPQTLNDLRLLLLLHMSRLRRRGSQRRQGSDFIQCVSINFFILITSSFLKIPEKHLGFGVGGIFQLHPHDPYQPKPIPSSASDPEPRTHLTPYMGSSLS